MYKYDANGKIMKNGVGDVKERWVGGYQSKENGVGDVMWGWAS